MIKKYRKSVSIAVPIIISVAANLFVIVIVLSFFYFFKYQINLVMVDQYKWNKIQEVPLDLLSMDVGGESFVSRMNKVHYGFADENQLRDETGDILSEQIVERGLIPTVGEIKVGDMTFTYKIPCTQIISGCSIVEKDKDIFTYECSCSGGCPTGEKFLGEVKKTMYHYHCVDFYGVCDCMVGVDYKLYSARFPFPLSFNGADEFIDELSYEVTEKR